MNKLTNKGKEGRKDNQLEKWKEQQMNKYINK